MTFMSQTCRAANLRPLLQDPKIQQAIQEVISVYSRVSNEDPRGTRVRDAFTWVKTVAMAGVPRRSEKPSTLDEGAYLHLINLLNAEVKALRYVDQSKVEHQPDQHILRRTVTNCVRVQIGGVMFKPHHLSSKDCNVVYTPRDSQSIQAGQITRIFLHKRLVGQSGLVEETFVAIQRLSPLSTLR